MIGIHTRASRRTGGLWLALLLLALVAATATSMPTSQPGPGVWLSKPVLGYFALTPSLALPLRQGSGVDEGEIQSVQAIAVRERTVLRNLERSSAWWLRLTWLPLNTKRVLVFLSGYNRQVQATSLASDLALRQALSPKSYYALVSWIEARWSYEQAQHGLLAAPLAAARTFRIYATYYDAGGAYTVALPDKCLKYANSGSGICKDNGYQTGQGYSVFISYDKKFSSSTVNESGPWNIDDNYWSAWNDPQPRRMFADLPVGMPEAQAAFFNGYNGGVDQYGRKVTAPFGIDLSKGVWDDLGMKANDWVDISYLWTEGWESSPGTPSGNAPGGAPTLVTATPNADGSIVHTVVEGQALWNIAAAYGISLVELLEQNNLSENSFIRPGDQLLIQAAPPTATPTPSPTTTPSRTPRPPSATPSPSSTPPPPTETPLPSATPTSALQGALTKAAQPGTVAGLALALIVGGAVLVLTGSLAGRKARR